MYSLKIDILNVFLLIEVGIVFVVVLVIIFFWGITNDNKDETKKNIHENNDQKES